SDSDLLSFPTRRSSDLVMPSRLALSKTCLTRSGRERALPTKLFSANSTTILSVPAETRLAETLTSACPSLGVGVGTSSIVVLPRSEEHTSELQSRENLV